MVNVFGCSSGKRGPPGPPGEYGPPGKKGRDGDGLSAFFFSKQLAQWFYQNLSFSCYFKDEQSGLISDKGKVTAIKNQVGANNAIAINTFESLSPIPDYGYGLKMNKSLYRIDNLDWALGETSAAIFVFAFKIDAWPKTSEYIFHAESGDRAIYLNGENLVIQTGTIPHQSTFVKYLQDEWNICFIEFNNCSDCPSRYKINDQEGTFTTETSKGHIRTLYLGGKENYYFHGVLARFDFFSNHIEEKGDEMGNLPDSVKKSFIKEFYELAED